MTAPLVTAIVPVFNGARFLAQALGSIAAQTHQPIEIIVVDDGSTDGSDAIASEREVLVIKQPQRGVAAARNVGIAASRTPIVALLDQDDLWLPRKIELQVAALHAHPEHVSLVLNEYFLEPPLTAPPKWFAKPELLDAPHPGYAPSCLAFTRETFERIGEFNESLAQASDLEWIARAKSRGVAFELIDELLVRKRIHETNDSASPTAFREMMQVVRAAAAQRRNA